MSPALSPAITPFYAAILGLIYVILSLRIPRLRIRYRIGLGDGDVPELRKAVRVHANFAEYVPVTILLLYFVELAHYSAWFIHLLAVVLVVSRGLHAYGLTQTSGHSPGRFLGTILTLSILAICSLLLLLKSAILWLS